MATPRDAIAGLSERLRADVGQRDIYRTDATLLEAATQLDSLLKERDALRNEINDWANEVARYKSYTEKFDQENDALQARVKELEAFASSESEAANKLLGNGLSLVDRLEAAESRATRLQQERDEAMADSARLDFLDQMNSRLNAHYGTTYKWELILNHNVNRLMLNHLSVDLNHAKAHGLKSCRDAIDAEMKRLGFSRDLIRRQSAPADYGLHPTGPCRSHPPSRVRS